MIKKAFHLTIDYIKNNKHCLLALSWLVDSVLYMISQNVTAMREQICVNIPIDSSIPFIEYFVVPYMLWYPYIFVISIYLLIKSKRGFIDLYIALIAGMAVCYISCLILPMYFDRTDSPMLYARDNLLTDMCKIYHRDDAPTTIMPSLHVYMSVALAWAFGRYGDKRHLVWKIMSWVLAVLICLSTVFIKQHSALDGIVAVAAALVLCGISYYYPSGCKYNNDKEKDKEKEEITTSDPSNGQNGDR